MLDDDGKTIHYEHVAYLSEYPEEWTFPLGEEIKQKDENCQKCGKPWLEHEFAVPAPYCP